MDNIDNIEAQGIQGLQGTQGVQGLQGATGTQGVQGVQGAQGVRGKRGKDGISGVQGPDGKRGIQGVQGDRGPMGIQGTRGCNGVQGADGMTGVQGLQGKSGRPGMQGTRGCDGAQGSVGMKGTQGVQGRKGLQGFDGPMGVQGEPGAQGVQGLKGRTGDRGEMGYQGDDGEIGIQGLVGEDGAIWEDGVRLSGYNTHLFEFSIDEDKFVSRNTSTDDLLYIRNGARIEIWLDSDAYASIMDTGTIRIDRLESGSFIFTSYPVYYAGETPLGDIIDPEADINTVVELVYRDEAWYYSGGLGASTYTGSNSIDITNREISVRRSEAEGNSLQVLDDGLFVSSAEGIKIINVEIVDLTEETETTYWAVNPENMRVQVRRVASWGEYVDDDGNVYTQDYVNEIAGGHKYIVITTSDKHMHWVENDSTSDTHVDSFSVVDVPETQGVPAHQVLRITLNDSSTSPTTFDVNVNDIAVHVNNAELHYEEEEDKLVVTQDGILTQDVINTLLGYIDGYDCGLYEDPPIEMSLEMPSGMGYGNYRYDLFNEDDQLLRYTITMEDRTGSSNNMADRQYIFTAPEGRRIKVTLASQNFNPDYSQTNQRYQALYLTNEETASSATYDEKWDYNTPADQVFITDGNTCSVRFYVDYLTTWTDLFTIIVEFKPI